MAKKNTKNNWYSESYKKATPKIINGYDARSAREIYNWLEPRVWKQDEAKTAASILLNNTLEGRRQNIMFCGPTGCGKTYIWRVLSDLYPDLIDFFDGSQITEMGFKGDVKWATIIGNRKYTDNKPHILVIDEIDKMIAPKFTSNGENLSKILQAEALKIMEGTIFLIKDQDGQFKVDTANLSFVFCGAFSDMAHDLTDQRSTTAFGFGASPSQKTEAYSEPITYDDIINFGAMPEFMGRIERVVNLEPMSENDYYRILTESRYGPIHELERLYRASISVSRQTVQELSSKAFEQNLGMRGIRNALRARIDTLRFENDNLHEFEL